MMSEYSKDILFSDNYIYEQCNKSLLNPSFLAQLCYLNIGLLLFVMKNLLDKNQVDGRLKMCKILNEFFK